MNIEAALASAGTILPHSPASTEAIREFEEVHGIQLPADYFSFLQRFGGFGGSNSLFYGCMTSVRDLLGFYQSVALNDEPAAPEGCVLIGFGGNTVPECYIRGAGSEGIYWGEDWGNYGQIADGLGTFLERQVFLQTRIPNAYVPTTTDFVATSSNRDCINVLRYPLQLQGMKIENYSDRFALCGTFAGGSIIVEQWENQPCWLHLKTATLDDRTRFQAIVTAHIEVNVQ